MKCDFPIRMTDQRRVLMEELGRMRTHPTADELYQAVRRRLPKISLGTVYRNLEKMVDCGLVRKVDVPGERMRFDADTTPHYHVRCEICGRVGDVYADGEPALDAAVLKTDFRITGFNIEFTGLCPTCAKGS